MRVAAIQMRSGLDRARNVEDASALITLAARDGATFILTPEMTNVVDCKPKRLFASLPGEAQLAEVGQFAALADELGISLVIGSMALALPEENELQRAANRSYFFGPDGNIVSKYDKLHMFDVDLPDGETWKESKIYAPGNQAVCVRTDEAVVGQTICYDLRFPQLYRQLAQAGAQILLVPAAFTYQTGKAHWESLLRARAIETGSFVIAAAQGGEHEDGRKTWGHSMIIDPWGKVLALKDDTDPGYIVADIDLEQVALVRQQIPNLALDRDFNITNIS